MNMYRVIDKIFQYLDDNTLREAESFSAEWKQMFSAGKIWRKRFRDRVSCDYFDVILQTILILIIIIISHLLKLALHQVRLSQEWKGMLDVIKATEPNKINGEDGHRTVYHLIAEKLLVGHDTIGLFI